MTMTHHGPAAEAAAPLAAGRCCERVCAGDEKHDAERALDARRALGALRPGPAGHARRPSTTRTGTGSCSPRATVRPRYYAVLAAKGFIPADWLDDLAGPDSRLGHHPDRTADPRRRDRLRLARPRARTRRRHRARACAPRACSTPRVYVLLGDAELDEGSNHEAIAYAGATGLDNLTAIVVDNQSATHGWPGGIASRFTVNGWTAATVDGRDHDALSSAALTGHHGPDRPHVVVAVVEPKGVTTMRDTLRRHHHRAAGRGSAHRAGARRHLRRRVRRRRPRRHPDRVLNVGIREQLMVGVAGGLALTGLRPIVHSYAPFLVDRAYEQIKLDLDHQGVGAVLVSVGASYDGSAAGRTHLRPATWRCSTPCDGWTVHVPGHPDEVPALLRGRGRPRRPGLPAAVHAAQRRGRTAATARCGCVRHAGAGRAAGGRGRADARPGCCAATAGLDVTVAYTHTPRPFDTAGLRALAGDRDGGAGRAVPGGHLGARSSPRRWPTVPHRLLALGVGRDELRRYGTPARPRPLARPGRRRAAPLDHDFLDRRVTRGMSAATPPRRRDPAPETAVSGSGRESRGGGCAPDRGSRAPRRRPSR